MGDKSAIHSCVGLVTMCPKLPMTNPHITITQRDSEDQLFYSQISFMPGVHFHKYFKFNNLRPVSSESKYLILNNFNRISQIFWGKRKEGREKNKLYRILQVYKDLQECTYYIHCVVSAFSNIPPLDVKPKQHL